MKKSTSEIERTTAAINPGKVASPFVELEDDVMPAGTNARVVDTQQVGRVLGFGCNHSEQEAFEALKSFVKKARSNPKEATDAEFEGKVGGLLQRLGDEIKTDRKSAKQKSGK